MNGRSLAFAFAVAVLGVATAAAWWWLAGSDAPSPALAPDARAPLPAAAVTATAASTRSGAPDAVPRTRADAAAAPRDGGGAGGSGGVLVPGRRVLIDGTRDTTDANATMELSCLLPAADATSTGTISAHPVVVTAGAFTVTLPGVPAVVSFTDIASGTRRAVCFDDFPIASASTEIVVRAALQQSMTLRVVAADTGADLAGIVVDRSRRNAPDGHPGPDASNVLQHGRSPLRLEPRPNRTVERFFVRAPGYAWAAVELATTDAGERLLRLAPGGDLHVTVQGAVPDGAVVRVRGRGDDVPSQATPLRGAPLAEMPAQRLVRIDGLPARALAVALEQGDWHRQPVVLAHAVATVTASATGTATLVVTGETAAPPRVPVGGTLVVSPEWGQALWLELAPRGAGRAWQQQPVVVPLAAMTKVAANEYRWNEVDLPAGSLGVFVGGCEHRAIVEIAPGPAARLRVVVPDPSEVRVRVVDADDGTPIDWPARTAPGWNGAIDGWEGGAASVRMTADGDGWFRLRAPVGRIEIDAHPEGYEWSMTEHDVRPGRNEVIVRIARACGVELVLKDGESVLPWPDHARTELVHTTAATGVSYWSANRIAAKQPGDHTLTLTGLGDYEPVPPRVVTIERAKWTRLEIQLVRKR